MFEDKILVVLIYYDHSNHEREDAPKRLLGYKRLKGLT